MKYFHCPKTFRSKPYGCGFGPVNGTVAFLDLGNKCPRCGAELKTHTKRDAQREYDDKRKREGVETVRALFGESAANEYAATKGIKPEGGENE